MSERVPLDALIRRVSRLAEKMFDKEGEIDPIWLVENAAGEQRTLITPVSAPTALAAADLKDRIANEMRKQFAENGVVRYACASEAWTLAEDRKDMTKERAALQYA